MKKFEELLLKQWMFIILLGLASASVIGATQLFLQHNVGLLNEVFIGEMLKMGRETGDYSSASSFASGFLLARLLEAPLVGILDIGGSLMTGIGVGIPALLLLASFGFIFENFYLAMLLGFVIGCLIGLGIIILKKVMPDDLPVGATAVMMGAGNKVGEAFGPLVILYSISYSTPAGIGAIIGSLLFYKTKKPIVGGAILGALIMCSIFLLFNLPIHPPAKPN
ncbi:membrane protein [Erysipelotrichaceae bacterium]|nr:membrane protein [Erysipelotrichaceae bacterium]